MALEKVEGIDGGAAARRTGMTMASMPLYVAKRHFEIMPSRVARKPFPISARHQSSISFPVMQLLRAGGSFVFFSFAGGGSGSSLRIFICDARGRRC